MGCRKNQLLKEKTWLQNYIEYKYGIRRLVKGISLETKSKHNTHAFMKHPLLTVDIFLFNIPKCVDTFTEINYEMLEGIKDGDLFPLKYDSQRIKVKIPNIVRGFSSDEPNRSRLEKDSRNLFQCIDLTLHNTLGYILTLQTASSFNSSIIIGQSLQFLI